MNRRLFLAIVISLAVVAFQTATPDPGRAQTMILSSSAFKNGGAVPALHTCDGQDSSPPLSWTGVPSGAKSLAVICEDPDAPSGIWSHWVVFGIPPEASGLDGGLPATASLPNGTRQGKNSWGRIGWNGPCPPSGEHHYVFRVFALDKDLSLDRNATRETLMRAMQGHIMSQGQLTGIYKH